MCAREKDVRMSDWVQSGESTHTAVETGEVHINIVNCDGRTIVKHLRALLDTQGRSLYHWLGSEPTEKLGYSPLYMEKLMG